MEKTEIYRRAKDEAERCTILLQWIRQQISLQTPNSGVFSDVISPIDCYDSTLYLQRLLKPIWKSTTIENVWSIHFMTMSSAPRTTTIFLLHLHFIGFNICPGKLVSKFG